MINKYKNDNGELKEYKAKKVKTGTAKNGKPFTVFQISDAKQVDGKWQYDNYGVFSWQPNIKLADDDKITFEDIIALEVKEEEYNGTKSLKKTIFANINVISANPQQKQIEVFDNMQPIDETDSLPF